MKTHLEAIKKKHEGLRDIARADLETYLTNRVGIGEHPNFGEEIEKKIEEISKHQSVIDTIDQL
tara:strand:+ start:194 stop:385 length:192 start_codon:yes stop_codon:yes gene_type:complete